MTKLIIALDNLSIAEAKEKIAEIEQHHKDNMTNIIFKVNDLIALVWFEWLFSIFQNSKAFLMLDTKYHDIENTMKNYLKQLASSKIASKVAILTVHASVWKKALQELKNLRDKLSLKDLKIFAITALTSLDDEDTIELYGRDAKETVLSLANIAYKWWVDGVVCSAQESQMIKQVFWQNFLTLTPWIRFENDEKWDQKRVATIEDAVQNGSDYIVMGRPILEASNINIVIEDIQEKIQKFSYKEKWDFNFEKIIARGNWEQIFQYIGVFYIRPEWWKYCRLASGLLSDGYINIAMLERYPNIIRKAVLEIREKLVKEKLFSSEEKENFVVIGAQMGSVRISSHLWEVLGVKGTSIYTEKGWNENKEMFLKRHLMNLEWKKIILSEDIVTKWTTIKRMKHFLKEHNAELIAITCVWNRTWSDIFDWIPIISCFIPPAFSFFYDDRTPLEARGDAKLLPNSIAENPKNDWDSLIKSIKIE